MSHPEDIPPVPAMRFEAQIIYNHRTMRCRSCGEHYAGPHAPECPHNDTAPVINKAEHEQWCAGGFDCTICHPDTAPERPTITYSHVSVELTGKDGDELNLIGLVARALRDGGVPAGEVAAFTDEALVQATNERLHSFLLRTVHVR